MTVHLSLKDCIHFGKYKGKTMEWIATSNPSYIAWMKDNLQHIEIGDDVWRIAVCVGILESDERAERYGSASDFGFPEF